MARVPSLAQTEQTLRPLATAVRKLAVAGRDCANCGSAEIRPSNRRNALDILLACVFLAPFRCRVCRGRFYRMWRPGMQRLPAPAGAPLFMMSGRSKLSKRDLSEPQRPWPPVPSPRSQPELIPPARKPEAIATPLTESPAVEPIAPPLPPAATPAPILILESDLSIRKLLGRLLERRGYYTVEIARAEDLAAEMLDRSVNLLIVDISTAEAGVQAVVKLAGALPGLKILALSAEPLPDNEIPDRLLVLPKPFSLDSFVDGVDFLVGRAIQPNPSL